MTKRERTLGMVAVAMLGVFAVLGLVWFYQVWTGLDDDIKGVSDQVTESQAKIDKARADAPKLEHWRRLSLSSNIDAARGEYKHFLFDLMHKTGVTLDTFPPTPNDTKSTTLLASKNKQPVYTGLNFNIKVKAKMTNLVKFLEEFQKAPRMHRIKTMVIERTDNSAKKDPEGMSVQMGIEALIILDAEKDLKKKNTPDKVLQDRNLQVAVEGDLLMGLRRGPVGLFTGRWALGPTGSVVLPLNAPLSSRNYNDIATRNIFIAPPLDGFTPDKGWAPPSDEAVNRMKYNRFIGLVSNPKGGVEAKFWDASTNEYQRVRAFNGFNKVHMVHTGLVEVGEQYLQLPLVTGLIQKINDHEIVLRVSINAGDPEDTPWWRYPKDSSYYKLHKEDFARLVKAEKLRTQDQDHLYVVDKKYWSAQLLEKKINVTGKHYVAQIDGSRGDVAYEDGAVAIIRPESWPPQASFEPPAVGANRLYPETFKIYGVHDKHFDVLLAAKKVKKEDIDDLYAISSEYWDVLRQDGLVKTEGNAYVIYKKLMKIEVADESGGMVVFRVPKKYCFYAGVDKTDEHAGTPSRWHEGFLVLKMDRMVQDSLMDPLSEAEVNKLLRPAPPDSGTGGN